MPMFYDSIPTDLGEWALSQPLFFTASAPLHATNTHVNVSPKGLLSSTLTILDPNTCAYLDGTGSGIETVSHVYESGRVTLMFCSFGKGPRICRFFCRGRVVEWDAPEFGEWVRRMGKAEGLVSGVRAVVVLHVWQVQTSCGWGVPLMDNDASETALADRPTMNNFCQKYEAKGKLRGYQAGFNSKSLDGLPGLRVARRDQGERLWLTDAKAWARRIKAQKEGILVGLLLGILAMILAIFGISILRPEIGRIWMESW